jgi:ABC-type uncharacterized transport system substrate-binding protein
MIFLRVEGFMAFGRRQFLAGLAGSAAWPVAAWAQQAALPVVGYLRSGARAASSQLEAAFRQGLMGMGFVEGRNLAIDYRYAENQNDRLPALVADLLRRQVAVIYAGESAATVIAKAATTSIPIVFKIGGDPVQLGLVASLKQPGGNLTGVSFLQTTTSGIRLQMLHEAAPSAVVMGLLLNPTNPRAISDQKASYPAAAR